MQDCKCYNTPDEKRTLGHFIQMIEYLPFHTIDFLGWAALWHWFSQVFLLKTPPCSLFLFKCLFIVNLEMDTAFFSQRLLKIFVDFSLHNKQFSWQLCLKSLVWIQQNLSISTSLLVWTQLIGILNYLIIFLNILFLLLQFNYFFHRSFDNAFSFPITLDSETLQHWEEHVGISLESRISLMFYTCINYKQTGLRQRCYVLMTI